LDLYSSFSSLLVTFVVSGRAKAWNPAGTPAASHTTIQSSADVSSAKEEKDVQSYKLSPEKYQKAHCCPVNA